MKPRRDHVWLSLEPALNPSRTQATTKKNKSSDTSHLPPNQYLAIPAKTRPANGHSSKPPLPRWRRVLFQRPQAKSARKSPSCPPPPILPTKPNHASPYSSRPNPTTRRRVRWCDQRQPHTTAPASAIPSIPSPHPSSLLLHSLPYSRNTSLSLSLPLSDCPLISKHYPPPPTPTLPPLRLSRKTPPSPVTT